MEHEQGSRRRVKQSEPLLPVLTPAQQAYQRKVFQGYAQEQEAAPVGEQERQRQALPGQLQAFTRLAQTGPAHVQRQRAAPVLQAAQLRQQDELAMQRAQNELSTVQRSVQASSRSLSAYGLAPAGPLDVIQLQREEDRQAALVPVAPLPLSSVQRQALMQHAEGEIGSALTRDARYLPASGRADVAHAAVQRYAQQGLDREALRSVMVQRAPDENTRESVTRLLTAQRRQDTQAQEDKEERGLLLGHHGLQRQLQGIQEQHDSEHAQSLSERVQARVGAGTPLPTEVRRQLELGLNADLSRVRIHDDAEADKLAKSIQAVAFTSGQDIFFRAGKYQPNTQTGMALLLHEGTHTVQQAKGQAKPGIDADAGLEQEAVANEGKTGMSVIPMPETGASKAASSGRSAAGQAVQRLADPTPTTPADFWFDPTWTRTFGGTLDVYPITLTLTRSGAKVSGHYQYVGKKGQLALSGTIDPSNNMVMVTESDVAEPAKGAKAVLILSPVSSTQVQGSWSSQKSELPITLKLVQPQQHPVPQQQPAPLQRPGLPTGSPEVNTAVQTLKNQMLLTSALAREIRLNPGMLHYVELYVPMILTEALTENILMPQQVAYVLATAFHETRFGFPKYARSRSLEEDSNPLLYDNPRTKTGPHRMNHVSGRRDEGDNLQAYFNEAYGRRGNPVGNRPGTNDGYDYLGRGFVQLTGRENYQKMSKALAREGFQYSCNGVNYGGTDQPIDLLKNPDHVRRVPELAARVLVTGMHLGLFNGQAMDKYINSQAQDFRRARIVVNNDVAVNGELIAGYAVQFSAVLTAKDAWKQLITLFRGGQ